jgi:hypothetical protein
VNSVLMVPMVESAFGRRLESCPSVLCRCFWQESGFSLREEYFYKRYAFNAICIDNAATNYITLRHKKVHSRQL